MVCPPQLGTLTPGLSSREMYIKPHLSSHCWAPLLNFCFHGSSNASNLAICISALPLKGIPGSTHQKKSVPFFKLWQT